MIAGVPIARWRWALACWQWRWLGIIRGELPAPPLHRICSGSGRSTPGAANRAGEICPRGEMAVRAPVERPAVWRRHPRSLREPRSATPQVQTTVPAGTAFARSTSRSTSCGPLFRTGATSRRTARSRTAAQRRDRNVGWCSTRNWKESRGRDQLRADPPRAAGGRDDRVESARSDGGRSRSRVDPKAKHQLGGKDEFRGFTLQSGSIGSLLAKSSSSGQNYYLSIPVSNRLVDYEGTTKCPGSSSDAFLRTSCFTLAQLAARCRCTQECDEWLSTSPALIGASLLGPGTTARAGSGAG